MNDTPRTAWAWKGCEIHGPATRAVHMTKFAEALELELAALIETMVGGGMLDIMDGGGLSAAQKKLYAAWLVLHPDRAGTQPHAENCSKEK